MEKHCKNAMKIAQFLDQHAKVEYMMFIVTNWWLIDRLMDHLVDWSIGCWLIIAKKNFFIIETKNLLTMTWEFQLS